MSDYISPDQTFAKRVPRGVCPEERCNKTNVPLFWKRAKYRVCSACVKRIQKEIRERIESKK